MRKPIWYRAPSALMASADYTPTEKLIMVVLLDQTEGGAVELSAAELAAAVGCSVKTVQRAADRLAATGAIAVQHTPGRPSMYAAPVAEWLPPKQRQRPASTPASTSSLAAEMDRLFHL